MIEPVLDANIVIGWCFGREPPAASRALLAEVRESGAQAPDLLRFEVTRVIARRAAGPSLSQKRADWFADFFAGLPIAYDPIGVETQYAAARQVAERWRLTVKDAAYLELALRMNAPLATRDRPLRAAAQRAGAVLIQG